MRVSWMTLALATSLTLTLAGCGGGGGTTTPVNSTTQFSIDQTTADWTAELAACLQESGQNEAAQARSIAIVTTAMYDAFAIMDSQAVAVHTTDEKLEVYALPQHANTAVAQAAFRALYDVFPAQRGRIEARLQSYGLNPDDDNTYLDGPIGVGNLAARNVVSRFSDELRNKSADFTARKPFSVTSSAEFHANAQGNTAPSGQTPAEWLQLAQTSFAQSNQDLGKAVKFYLFVGNAMLDSGIAAAQQPSGDTHTALGAATSKAVRDFQGHDRLSGTAFNSLTNAVDATTLGADPSWKTLGESTTTQVWKKANNYFQGIR